MGMVVRRVQVKTQLLFVIATELKLSDCLYIKVNVKIYHSS